MNDIEGAIESCGYRVVRLLGDGSTGSVYEAVDRTLGQRVALKVLLRDTAASVYDFKHEFRALADVSHENLVTLHELRRVDKVWLLSMELVRGQSFLDYLSGSSLTEEPHHQDDGGAGKLWGDHEPLIERLSPAFAQLCDALHALHESGHVHRDVKPSNILVTEEGRVVVLDFGIVAELSASRHDQGTKGTPMFMAPEQLDNPDALSAATDFYAVGTLLYSATTGQLPFSGDVRQIFVAKRFMQQPPPAALRVPPALKPLAQLADDLLMRDPSQRPGYDEIRRRLGPALMPVAVSPRLRTASFVGRDPELEQLLAAYRDVQQGQRVAVLLSGDSGMGKSTLLRQFLRVLPAHTVILFGRCFELESVPFKALDPVVDELSSFLAELDVEQLQAVLPDDMGALLSTFPVIARVEAIATLSNERNMDMVLAGDVSRRGFVALAQLLDRIAASCPLVIAIDDLQYGDMESLPFLAELLAPRGVPMLVIASYNSAALALSPLLRRLRQLRASSCVEVVLSKLRNGDARALASQLMGDDVPGADIEALVAEAQGNPHLLQELSWLAATGAGTLSKHSRVTLQQTVKARCSRLSPDALEMLQTVSVAGWRVPLRLVTKVRRDQDADVARPLAELRTGRFVKLSDVAGQRCLETYHDSIREGVATALSNAERVALHTRIARALDDHGQDVERHLFALANHYYWGHHEGVEPRIVELNLRAGRHAARAGSFKRAYIHLRQAFVVAQRTNKALPDSDMLLLAEVCVQTGHHQPARDHFHTLLERGLAPLQQARIRHGLAQIEISRQAPVAAREQVHLGIAAISQPVPQSRLRRAGRLLTSAAKGVFQHRFDDKPASRNERQRLRVLNALYLELGYLSYFDLKPWGMIEGVMNAMSPVSQLGPSREQVEWGAYAAATLALLSFEDLSSRLFTVTAQMSEQLDDPLVAVRLRVFRGLAAEFLGDTLTAAQILTRILTDERPRLNNVDMFNVLGTLCWNMMMRGQVKDIPRWLKLGMERELLGGWMTPVGGHAYRSYAGPVWATLGHIEKGRKALELMQRSVTMSSEDKFRSAQYLTQSMLLSLEVDELGPDVLELLSLHERLGMRPVTMPFNLRQAYVARAYIYMRRAARFSTPQEVRALRKAVGDLRWVSRHPTLRAHLLVATAALMLHDGMLDEARKQLELALDLARRHHNPWARFEAQLVSGRLSQQRGDDLAATHARSEAISLAEQFGWPLRRQRAERALSG